MAFTIAKVNGDYAHMSLGNLYAGLFDLTFSNSYATGGNSITAADLGLRKLFGLKFIGGNAAAGELNYGFDTTNSKILVFCPTGGASAPTTLAAPAAAAPGAGTFAATATPAGGATPVTSTGAQPAIPVTFSGALAAPALTAGIGKEIGSTTDLSSITIRVMAFGN